MTETETVERKAPESGQFPPAQAQTRGPGRPPKAREAKEATSLPAGAVLRREPIYEGGFAGMRILCQAPVDLHWKLILELPIYPNCVRAAAEVRDGVLVIEDRTTATVIRRPE